MTEAYIKPEDVTPQDAQIVLDFLNSAESAEEIANAVEIPGERDVGHIVAQHILDRRKELGRFTNLEQVADVRQVGPERFTEIVTTLRKTQIGGEVMTTMNAFNSYVVRICGGTEGRVALLLCYNGTSFVGRIDFYPDGVNLSQDYLWHPNSAEYVVLHMPMSRFEAVMSTVRQEKPLCLYIDVNRGIGSVTPGHGHLATTEKEPVGEEEGTP